MIGPNATQPMNASQRARRYFSIHTGAQRRARPAISDTTTTGAILSMAEAITHGTRDASMPSVGHQIQKPEQIPATEPTNEASKNSNQPSSDKVVERTVPRETHAKGRDQVDRWRLGCIIPGHQHKAEPVAVKTIRSVSLLMNVLKRKIAEACSNRLRQPACKATFMVRPCNAEITIQRRPVLPR